MLLRRALPRRRAAHADRAVEADDRQLALQVEPRDVVVERARRAAGRDRDGDARRRELLEGGGARPRRGATDRFEREDDDTTLALGHTRAPLAGDDDSSGNPDCENHAASAPGRANNPASWMGESGFMDGGDRWRGNPDASSSRSGPATRHACSLAIDASLSACFELRSDPSMSSATSSNCSGSEDPSSRSSAPRSLRADSWLPIVRLALDRGRPPRRDDENPNAAARTPHASKIARKSRMAGCWCALARTTWTTRDRMDG